MKPNRLDAMETRLTEMEKRLNALEALERGDTDPEFQRLAQEYRKDTASR
jgi:hypothetical protein